MLNRSYYRLCKYGILLAAVLLLAYGVVKITSVSVLWQSAPVPSGGKMKDIRYANLLRPEVGHKEVLVTYPQSIKADQVFDAIERSKIWKRYDLLEENQETIKSFGKKMDMDSGLPDVGSHDGVASHVYYSRNEKYFLTVVVSDKEIYYQVFRRNKRVQDNYYNMMIDLDSAIGK